MEYINVRGLDKPVPRLIFGTAWFSLDAEAEAHKMMDLYVERGGTMIDTGRYYGKGNGIAKSEEILDRWANFEGEAQRLALPSAPKHFLHYFEENDRPQTKLDRNLENGMAVSIGRLRPDTQYDYKFVCLSHNTLRGAAGGGVLLAELLAAKGYFD